MSSHHVHGAHTHTRGAHQRTHQAHVTRRRSRPTLRPEWIALSTVMVLTAACASAWAIETSAPPPEQPHYGAVVDGTIIDGTGTDRFPVLSSDPPHVPLPRWPTP